jgi:hypothetical protein
VQYQWIKNAQSIIANAKTQLALELRRTGLEILEEMVSQLQPKKAASPCHHGVIYREIYYLS